MIFTPEENAARRQFHELFCTTFLQTCTRDQALNDESWTADTLDTILHDLHPDNPLIPSDIETMLQIGGMYDKNEELYFRLAPGATLFKEFVVAISPHISTGSFIQCQQQLNVRVNDSVAEFLVQYVDERCPATKIVSSDLYAAYHEWCSQSKYVYVGRRQFYTRLRRLGFQSRKCYIEGQSGVYCFWLPLKYLQEVMAYAEQGKQKEKEQRERAQGKIRDVTGTGTQGDAEDVSTAERSISAREDSGPGDPDYSGELSYASSIFDGGSGSVDESHQDLTVADGFSDEVPEARYDATTGVDQSSVSYGLKVSACVKQLPSELRQFFRQMKVTYKVSPEHFQKDEFIDNYPGTYSEEMYQLFVAYAEGRETI